MPELARKYDQHYYYGDVQRTCTAVPGRKFGEITAFPGRKRTTYQPHKRKPVKNKKFDRDILLARFFGLSILCFGIFFVLPSVFANISGSIFTKSPYPNIKTDYRQLVFPTQSYLKNNSFLNHYLLSGVASSKKAQMLQLPLKREMQDLEISIQNIMPMFPAVHPSVFVMDYDTGDYAGINYEESFPAASIIKIPVLLDMFKSIELGQVSLYDRVALKDYYRAEGSGALQFKAENSMYTMDNLAQVMITDSDNSATNMIMAKTGSMTYLNQSIRNWGISNTSVNTWLPDLSGTNRTTAADLARMLYNIDNPKFLSNASRVKIIDYMSHVKNDRLLPAGLGAGASIIHKTGDIGSMLGDAGIVTTANGKKYIVVIMAKRPHNSQAGKDFIVKASEIIYNYMSLK